MSYNRFPPQGASSSQRPGSNSASEVSSKPKNVRVPLVSPAIFGHMKEKERIRKRIMLKDFINANVSKVPVVQKRSQPLSEHEVLFDGEVSLPFASLKIEYYKTKKSINLISGNNPKPIVIPCEFLRAIIVAETSCLGSDDDVEKASDTKVRQVAKVLQRVAKDMKVVLHSGSLGGQTGDLPRWTRARY